MAGLDGPRFLIEAATAWLFKNRRRSHLFIGWALPAESATKHGHDAGATVSRLVSSSMTEAVWREKGRMAKPGGIKPGRGGARREPGARRAPLHLGGHVIAATLFDGNVLGQHHVERADGVAGAVVRLGRRRGDAGDGPR